MAAGLGFKTFTTGEVLTAADVNGYLMQGILVFATEAARNSAITSPQEGQFAFTKDNNSLWYYTGSAWVASGATGDIEGVTAGVGISGGGTSGTVTITNSMATAIDAKGDLVAGTGADTFARLAVGANNTVLTAASGEATGLKWAAVSANKSISEVATGTVTSTVKLQVTGLSSYDDIFFAFKSVNTTGDACYPNFTINDSTSSVYYQYNTKNESNNTNSNNYNSSYAPTTKILLTYNPMANSSTDNYFYLRLTNCAATGFTNFSYGAFYLTNSSSYYLTQTGAGVFASSAAVSSVEWRNDGGGTANTTGGTYYVWAG